MRTFETPEPDEPDEWALWKRRHESTRVPGSVVREGRRYLKPAGRHPRKGFVHGGGMVKTSRKQREECNELLDLIASLEAQIAVLEE
jgi:hypothetical protein